LAIDLYKEVLQIDPISGEALTELEGLYRGAEDWEALLEVLQRQSEAAVNANQALEIKCRMGQLYEEQLDNPTAAAEVYQQALATAPKNVRSLKALEGLYERTGQIERYIDLLGQQLAGCSSDEERVQIYRQMATVWEERLDDLDRATECMEQALNIDPSEANHRSLRRLYRQSERYDDLVQLLSGRINATIGSASGAEERCTLHLELAQLYEGPLSDPQRAVALYREILSVDHENARALGGLARFHERSEDWEPAVEVLTRITDTLQEPAELADAHYRLGRIHEQHLQDPDNAREHYTKALETGATHAGAVTRMLEISRQLGEWSTAASLMVRLEAVTSDSQQRASLLREAGTLCLQQLDDEARAVALLSRALEIDPDNVRVGELLEPIYSRDERHEQLEPVLDLLLREASQQDSRRILDLNYKLGKAAAALGKAEKALQHYTAVLEIDPSHMQTLVEMAALRRRSRR
jgi:tetratricopeptide (TPR) repeat protein